jgi:hypothetical protein
MTDKEQTDAFSDDLDKLVERYRQEFEMTYAQVVGTLHMKAWLMCAEANDRGDEV